MQIQLENVAQKLFKSTKGEKKKKIIHFKAQSMRNQTLKNLKPSKKKKNIFFLD